MHVERAEHLPTQHDDQIRELLRVLSGFRWRLGLERLLLFALYGLCGSALVLIALSVVTWLVGGVEDVAWVTALPVLAALGLGVARWPSRDQTARTADRRLVLAERLGTAVELAAAPHREGSPSGRFDRLQLRDAIDRARAAPKGWLALDRRAGRRALLMAALMILAGGSLVLPGLPRPTLRGGEQTTAADSETLALDLERAAPPDGLDLAVAAAQSSQPTQLDADLAVRVQQAQAERDALERLAQALSSVSAGQLAADALQRGDFSAARGQVQNLGEEADQLSEAAKQQLAKALEQAANSTGGDRQLADRERQAAQALSRNNYVEQRQALRQLGDQIERSGARSVPADQLARDLGRLQQQQQTPERDQAAGARSQGPGRAVVEQAGAGDQAAASADTGATGTGTGEQGGSGAGTGANADVLGGQAARLDTAGQRVEVPARLGSGPGSRPPDGTEDQTGADPTLGARLSASAEGLAGTQRIDQVAAEQNLVPGEQRPVVRGYFR